MPVFCTGTGSLGFSTDLWAIPRPLTHPVRIGGMETLRLDPAHPPLWQDGELLQFGVDALVTIAVTEVWMERLIHALRAGVPRRAFDAIAHEHGAPRAEARAFLETLAPVLTPDPVLPPSVRLQAADDVDVATAYRLGEALHDENLQLEDGDDAVALVLFHGVSVAARMAALLHDERPHLPIAFDGNGVTVGPLVRPGVTPCLVCRDGHDRENVPGWAAVHTQLMSRAPEMIPLRHIVDAARGVAELLTDDADGRADGTSRSIRIRNDGHRESRAVRFHEECLCRSPRGSAMAPAPLVRPIATTTAPAFARLA